MKLSVEDGIVVCSLENKSSAFLSDVAGVFKEFYRGKLKMKPPDPEIFEEESERLCVELLRLGWIIDSAVGHGIEIDPAVYEKESEIKKLCDKYAPSPEPIIEPSEYEKKCKYGCKGCRYLKRWNDDHVCTATGDILSEKNVPGYDGFVYQLFNYVPFPNENCIFNKNKKE